MKTWNTHTLTQHVNELKNEDQEKRRRFKLNSSDTSGTFVSLFSFHNNSLCLALASLTSFWGEDVHEKKKKINWWLGNMRLTGWLAYLYGKHFVRRMNEEKVKFLSFLSSREWLTLCDLTKEQLAYECQWAFLYWFMTFYVHDHVCGNMDVSMGIYECVCVCAFSGILVKKTIE